MNQWLAIIRRETGKPNIFEEFRRPERNDFNDKVDNVVRFVVRSNRHSAGIPKVYVLLV